MIENMTRGKPDRTTNLNGANMSHTILAGANLRHAFMTGTNLSGAILLATDLRGTLLFGADFGGADLSFSDLRDASFDNPPQAQLDRACGKDAKLPEGLTLKPCPEKPVAPPLNQKATP